MPLLIPKENDYLLQFHNCIIHFCLKTIWKAGDPESNIVINVTFNMFVIRPVGQNNFISTIKYCLLDVSIIKVIIKITIFFVYIWA